MGQMPFLKPGWHPTPASQPALGTGGGTEKGRREIHSLLPPSLAFSDIIVNGSPATIKTHQLLSGIARFKETEEIISLPTQEDGKG